jgi:hypothetical protein
MWRRDAARYQFADTESGELAAVQAGRERRGAVGLLGHGNVEGMPEGDVTSPTELEDGDLALAAWIFRGRLRRITRQELRGSCPGRLDGSRIARHLVAPPAQPGAKPLIFFWP